MHILNFSPSSRRFPVSRLALLAWLAAATCGGGETPSTKEPQEEPPPRPKSEDDIELDPTQYPEELSLKLRTWELEDVSRATDFQFVPGTNGEILVTTQRGGVHRFGIEGDEVKSLGHGVIPNTLSRAGCGLLSFAFDSMWKENGFVYFTRCLDGETNVLTRHRWQGDSLSSLADDEARILTIQFEKSEKTEKPWHRFGSIGFEPDGTLWALMGDGQTDSNGQDKETLASALVRVIPNREADGEGYEPAPDNPFSGEDGREEIFAYGLRSPWRGSRDSKGRFWIGDVGSREAEEVNFVDEPGLNLGWRLAEGPCEAKCEGLRDPVTSWTRKSDHPYVFDDPDTEPESRRTVWVSDVYENPTRDRYFGLMDDAILFGDYFAGWVRLLKLDEEGGVQEDVLVGHQDEITAVRLGPDGFLYGIDLSGTLFRFVPEID